MARMDQGAGLTRSNEMQNLIKSENMPRGITPQVMPITEDIIDNEGGLTPQVMPITEDILNQGGDMPMMSDEEKRLFMDLFEKGIPEDMIIDIMASAKVGQAVEGATTPSLINPAEFGGLPNTGSSPAGNPSMPTGAGAMTNEDMTMYLQNKVNEIKSRTGGGGGGAVLPKMGALPMGRPNTLTDPSLNERTSNPNMNQPMNT